MGRLIFLCFKCSVVALALPLHFFPSVSATEIYKWVDSNGRTHYGERKLDEKAKTVEVKSHSPAQQPAELPSQDYWRDQEMQLQQRLASKNEANKLQNKSAKSPPSMSGGSAKWQDSDQWRCNLAKDIINGSVKRASGRPTTQDDIKLAEENVRAFCR